MALGSQSFLLAFLFVCSYVSAYNITQILEAYPDYSIFNQYLTDTKLSDDINSRNTITVLALNNAAMSSVITGNSLPVIKNILSLHVLLDFYNPSKLQSISNGSIVTASLYQTTGKAPGNFGFVNITDLPGGKVAFGSAVADSDMGSTYVKSVIQIGSNISVVEVSSPIMAPGVLVAPAPSSSDVNITAVLVKAGCKKFADLITATGVIKAYEAAVSNGLTIFAPDDEAFLAKGLPDLSMVNASDLVKLLLYHASPLYATIGTLKTTKTPISTLASSAAVGEKYVVSASNSGSTVTLRTGIDNAVVANTALDMAPLSILVIDNVLLPSELFAPTPVPAPAPSPELEPSPSPSPADEPPSAAKKGSEAPVGSEKASPKSGGSRAGVSAGVVGGIAGLCAVVFGMIFF